MIDFVFKSAEEMDTMDINDLMEYTFNIYSNKVSYERSYSDFYKKQLQQKQENLFNGFFTDKYDLNNNFFDFFNDMEELNRYRKNTKLYKQIIAYIDETLKPFLEIKKEKLMKDFTEIKIE